MTFPYKSHQESLHAQFDRIYLPHTLKEESDSALADTVSNMLRSAALDATLDSFDKRQVISSERFKVTLTPGHVKIDFGQIPQGSTWRNPSNRADLIRKVKKLVSKTLQLPAEFVVLVDYKHK